MTEEGWKLFRERLEEAARALEQAWLADPRNGEAMVNMMTVAMGQSRPLRQQMAYFAEATRIDPDNWPAYSNALYLLRPRWGGSHEAMRAFANKAFDKVARDPQIDARIARVLIVMHEGFARDLVDRSEDDLERLCDERDYWRRPEAWKDVQRVYRLILERRPRSRLSRSEYAYYAHKCRQWESARRLVTELGGELATAPFGGPRKARAALRDIELAASATRQ